MARKAVKRKRFAKKKAMKEKPILEKIDPDAPIIIKKVSTKLRAKKSDQEKLLKKFDPKKKEKPKKEPRIVKTIGREKEALLKKVDQNLDGSSSNKPPRKKREKKLNPSTIQSVVFSKNWTKKMADDWLKENGLEVIDPVHMAKGGSMTFTIQKKDKFKKLGFKRVPKKGISFVIGSI